MVSKEKEHWRPSIRAQGGRAPSGGKSEFGPDAPRASPRVTGAPTAEPIVQTDTLWLTLRLEEEEARPAGPEILRSRFRLPLLQALHPAAVDLSELEASWCTCVCGCTRASCQFSDWIECVGAQGRKGIETDSSPFSRQRGHPCGCGWHRTRFAWAFNARLTSQQKVDTAPRRSGPTRQHQSQVGEAKPGRKMSRSPCSGRMQAVSCASAACYPAPPACRVRPAFDAPSDWRRLVRGG